MSASRYFNSKGISIIEILISYTLLSIALASILWFVSFSLRQSSIIKESVQATSLAREAMEAVRNFRDNTPWANGVGSLQLDVAYHPQKSVGSPAQWEMVQGIETLNGFSRSVAVSQVLREDNSNIVPSGGISDQNTRKVTVTVSFTERGKTHQVQLVSYLTNWKQ